MFIGTRERLSQTPPDTHMQVDGNAITPRLSLKNLGVGVYFDSHLLFDAHVSEKSKKVCAVMHINRLREYFNKTTRISVIQSLVMSIINYGISIWGAANASQIQRVLKLQNFAAKAALGGTPRSEHTTPFIEELGWLKIKEKHTF